MPYYTLSINIMSDNRELLENLLVTLESVHDNLREIDTIELTAADNRTICFNTHKPTILQRNLFLDKWTLLEA